MSIHSSEPDPAQSTMERLQPSSVVDPNMEHSVEVFFDKYYARILDPLIEVQERLADAIEAAGVGEMNGNEIECKDDDEPGDESGSLFMSGPDADRLYEVIRPILLTVDFMEGAHVLLQYGPPGTNAPFREFPLA